MEVSEENQLGLVVRDTSMESFQDLLDKQKEQLFLQIDEIQNVVLAQCELTGVNPLSEEMAAGSLSVKIGKRPRDLLKSKAIKYMESVFSIKDEVNKKEIREIGGLLGLTATQVREFFTNQRSRVRKFAGLSREKAIKVKLPMVKEQQNEVLGSLELQKHTNPVPLNTVVPLASEGPSCSRPTETVASNDAEKSFVEKIFLLMRMEETFSGQVKLLEWILQIKNTMILLWFLNNGGVMILATWLSQAATEEQTSVLHAILKVLCHLPVNKALPAHMSAVLQSVNRLRFYRASVIANRARILVARWSKGFARNRSSIKVNGSKSVADVESEILLKKSIEEVMNDESWEAQAIKEDALVPFSGSSELRKVEPLKLLTSSTVDSNKRLCLGISSSQTKERRKVLLVEHPGQKLAGRSIQTARSTPTIQSRPLSADDIQKAKMRAHFLRNKHGKSLEGSNDVPQAKAEEAPPKCSSFLADTSASESIPLITLRTNEQKQPLPVMLPEKTPTQKVQPEDKLNLDLDELQPKKQHKRIQIPWKTPAEIRVNNAWRLGAGEESKEVEFQTNRNRREKEAIYSAPHEIPPNPKQPWDKEMEYDDSLTPEIPSTQLPDNVAVVEEETETTATETTMVDSFQPSLASASALSSNSNNNSRSSAAAEPDYDLLQVLLQTPDLVFALTSGQTGISNEETMRVLDMIKARQPAAAHDPVSIGLGRNANNILPVSLSSPTPSGEPVGRNGNNILPVSLPSPTPSSRPVTNHWGAEDGRNPFSRQIAANMGHHQTQTAPLANMGHHQTQSAPFIAANMGHHHQTQSAPFIPHQTHSLNMNNNIANPHHNYGNIIMDPSLSQQSQPSQYHQKPMQPRNSWGPQHTTHIQNRDDVRSSSVQGMASYGGWERENFNNSRQTSQAGAEYNHHLSGYHQEQGGGPPSRTRTWSSSLEQRDQYKGSYGDRKWHEGRG